MLKAFLLLVTLLLSVPLDPLLPPGFLDGLRLLLAGTGLLLVSHAILPREGAHLAKLVRFWALGPLAAIAWLILQLMPLPLLAHSIWGTVGGTLGQKLEGRVTVDTGATLLAALKLLELAAAALLAAAVLIDRQRAEWSLGVLACAAVALAVLSWLADGSTGVAEDAAVLGMLLGLSCAYLFFERFATRHARQPRARERLLAVLAASVLALAACGALVSSGGTRVDYCAGGFPLALLAGIVAARRLGLGVRTALVATLAAFAGIVALAVRDDGGSLLVAFTKAPPGPQAIALRMVSDAPWSGTGGGTAGLLSGLYRGFKDAPAYNPPSVAAALVVELGRAAAVTLLLGVAFATLVLVRKAMLRGRDSIYAALGAATALAVTLGGFLNAGLLQSTGLSLLIAGLLGLALAQSESRRS